jgi:hypothetical protein
MPADWTAEDDRRIRCGFPWRGPLVLTLMS